MKKIMLSMLLIFMSISCSKGAGKNELVWVIYSGTGEDYLQELMPIAEEYAKVNTNVTIKLEVLPSTDYDKIMQIRATSKKLPDIFVTRVKTMNAYVDHLLPLNELEAVKNNIYAESYNINGNVLGIPFYGFHEYVYYSKAIFEELNIAIPTTWSEFTNAITKIKENSDYIPLALGGKEAWTAYPFAEFVPLITESDDKMYSSMAYTDTPFAKGSTLYKAYDKVYNLFAMKPSGDDPFGYGFQQATDMFLSGKAAMIAAGQWHYKEGLIEKTTPEGASNIGVFYLPVRDKKTDPFRYIVTGEVFLGVPKDGKNNEEALKFIEWLFASDYYKDFIVYNSYNTTVKEESGEVVQTIFTEALAKLDNPIPVLQLPEDDEFEKIKNYTEFHTRTMGQAMLSGTNFNDLMSGWDKKWTEARKDLAK